MNKMIIVTLTISLIVGYIFLGNNMDKMKEIKNVKQNTLEEVFDY